MTVKIRDIIYYERFVSMFNYFNVSTITGLALSVSGYWGRLSVVLVLGENECVDIIVIRGNT